MPTPRRDAPVPSARLIAALLACACTSGAHGEPAPAREPTPAPAREPTPPDPDGKLEYDEVWSFTGRVGVLRPAPAGWTLADAAPLPHDGEDGRMAGGYAVHLLTRPGHAGVLLAGDGLPSAFALLRGPCPERPAP